MIIVSSLVFSIFTLIAFRVTVTQAANNVEECYLNDNVTSKPQYTGEQRKTFTNRPCIGWKDFQQQNYEYRQRYLPELWPGEDLRANRCRNPDKRPGGPWCFAETTNPDFIHESCNIPPCECKPELSGNGVCDYVNNQQNCGYDGGDCCVSTCHCIEGETCAEGCNCANMNSEQCGSWREGDCRDPTVTNEENKYYIITLQTSREPGSGRKGEIIVHLHHFDGTYVEYSMGDTFIEGETVKKEVYLRDSPVIGLGIELITEGDNANSVDDWKSHAAVIIESEQAYRYHIFEFDGTLDIANSYIYLERSAANMVPYLIEFTPGHIFLGESNAPIRIVAIGEGSDIGIAGKSTSPMIIPGHFKRGEKVTCYLIGTDVGDIAHLDVYGMSSEDRLYIQGGISVTKRGTTSLMVGTDWVPKVNANVKLLQPGNTILNRDVSSDGEKEQQEQCFLNNEYEPTVFVSANSQIKKFKFKLKIGSQAAAGRVGNVRVMFMSNTGYKTRQVDIGGIFDANSEFETEILINWQGIYQIHILLDDNLDDNLYIQFAELAMLSSSEFLKKFVINQWLDANNPEVVADSHDRSTAIDDLMPDLEFDTKQFYNNFRFKEVDIIEDKLECALEEKCLIHSVDPILSGLNVGNKRYLLNFETTVWNVGDATFYPPSSGNGVFHECHKHWHGMVGYAEYILTKAGDNTVVITGHKASHCCMDSTCVRSGKEKKHKCVNQGIQTGCADSYRAKLDCQWIDITPVPSGIYMLNVYINRYGLVDEKSMDNNNGHILFEYDTSQVAIEKKIKWACLVDNEHQTQCPPGSPTYNPLRFGIKEDGSIDTEPGSRIHPLPSYYNDPPNRWN